MHKISRSAVEQHMSCRRCFLLAYKYKIRPFSLPFTLNSAVDNLCKNEFDHYREKAEPHPMFLEHGIDAVPFAHEKMDEWRNNFKGIRYINQDDGYNFGGAIDDVWIKPSGELIIVDVKSTAKNIFDWEDTYSKYDYAKGYQRQLEMYQWLFRKNGFEVAKESYLVYFNGKKNEPMFNQRLEFDLHLVRLECDDSWVENEVLAAVKTLQEGTMPEASSSCENCNYLRKRWEVSQKKPDNLL